MTQVVRFPDAVFGRLATIAERREMKIADVIVEATNRVLGTSQVVVERVPEKVKAKDVLDVLAQVQELHELNRSQEAIAAETGLSVSGTIAILERLRLRPSRQPKPHAIDLVAFQRLYDRGWSDREIAAELHVSPPTVGRERRALGLPAVGKPGRHSDDYQAAGA